MGNMKICILGHMHHGKDTVSKMITEHTGLTFESSSEIANRLFIFDELKEKFGYKTLAECHKDRVNHRKLWHDMICDYNKDDKARLAKDILTENDMYNGMRSDVELLECKKQGLFDMIIGVYDPDKELEPKDSFDIDVFRQSDFIIITGDLETVKNNVKRFCRIFDQQRFKITVVEYNREQAESSDGLIREYKEEYDWNDELGDVNMNGLHQKPHSRDLWITPHDMNDCSSPIIDDFDITQCGCHSVCDKHQNETESETNKIFDWFKSKFKFII